MKPACVYYLSDPRDGEIRYIGVTTNFKNRYKDHLKKVTKTLKWCWVRELKYQGLQPHGAILQRFADIEEAKVAECYWIQYFRSTGMPLLNGTNGGDGVWGRVVSEEERARRSAQMKEKWKNVNFADKMRQSRLGHVVSLETKQKIGSANRGKLHSETTKNNISDKASAQWSNRANRLEMSRIKGGRPVLASDGRYFDSAAEAARQLGLHASNIHKVLTGELKTTGKFGFMYAR